MRRIPSACLVLVICLLAHAQTTAPAPAPAPPPPASAPSIDSYIHNGWDTLSRSMSECKSVVDPKVTAEPVLYLPAGIDTPADVTAMQSQCKVDVEHLPRKMTKMGDVSVAEIKHPGLLYLPNRYVVPGGRFNEMYGWDSYFIILGLVDDQRIPLARGMVENFFFEIENYGALLNANRTYFFTRSQPPLLSSMIRAVSAGDKDTQWLARAYEYATRDYNLWVNPPHLAGDTGLARYDDIGEGPVPEMADDNQYYPDVIRWLLAHPDVKTDYLINAPDSPSPDEAAQLAKTSCDISTSVVCANAHVSGHRLTRDFYHGDRAMRESGFDTSFRFGPFSGSTEEFAPVCLNSLLFKYETDMAGFATKLGRDQDAKMWTARAEARRRAVNKYLWHADKGLYYDYNFKTQHPSTYNFISTFYPLWAGLASKEQAAAVRGHLNIFEHDGGVAMSDVPSGMQWDLPFGWAPTNWFTTKGLSDYGYEADADRIAKKFSDTVRRGYQTDGTIREKYNMVTQSSNVQVTAGYRTNVIGFGWTNGVYLEMKYLLAEHKPVQATASK